MVKYIIPLLYTVTFALFILSCVKTEKEYVLKRPDTIHAVRQHDSIWALSASNPDTPWGNYMMLSHPDTPGQGIDCVKTETFIAQ